MDTIVKLRDILKRADLLTRKESVAIASSTLEGVSNPAKKFIVERMQILIKSLIDGLNAKNLM